MALSETQKLLDLAKAWATDADLHEKEMRRNRSFAQPGKEGYEFYLAEAARDEIKMNLCRSHSRQLTNLLNELAPQEAVSSSATK
jgi:hypothetical protein